MVQEIDHHGTAAGAQNAQDVINGSSEFGVTVMVVMPEESLESDTITASLSDGSGRASAAPMASTPGRGLVTAANIDASALKDFDSSALAVLLECRRIAQASGKAFTVRGVPAPLAELAGLYGVDELLALEPAPREAGAA